MFANNAWSGRDSNPFPNRKRIQQISRIQASRTSAP